jgi:hypothetical protein
MSAPRLAALSLAPLELRLPFDPVVTRYDGYAVGAPVTVVAVPEDPKTVVSIRMEDLAGDWVQDGPTLDVSAGGRVVVELARDGAAQTYEVVALPPGFPAPTASEPPTDDGRLLLGSVGPGIGWFSMVLDWHGTVHWYEPTEQAPFDVRHALSGRVTWVVAVPGSTQTITQSRDPATWDPGPAWLPAPTDAGLLTHLDNHEFVEREDGTAILLAYSSVDFDLSPYGGEDGATIRHEEVQQLSADGEILFRWSTETDFDPDAVRFWIPPGADGTAYEYAHLNSLDVDPNDGNWVISVRLADQVIKVARVDTVWQGAVVPAGDVIWRLGGVDSDFAFVGDDREGGVVGFAGQHSARMTGANTLLVYDNAMGRTPDDDPDTLLFEIFETGASRAVEYELDPVAMTATPIWSYELPEGGMTPAGGSVQRLADGSTVIGWGNRFFSTGGLAATWLDAAGDVVGSVELPAGAWSYRAWYSDASGLLPDIDPQ